MIQQCVTLLLPAAAVQAICSMAVRHGTLSSALLFEHRYESAVCQVWRFKRKLALTPSKRTQGVLFEREMALDVRIATAGARGDKNLIAVMCRVLASDLGALCTVVLCGGASGATGSIVSCGRTTSELEGAVFFVTFFVRPCQLQGCLPLAFALQAPADGNRSGGTTGREKILLSRFGDRCNDCSGLKCEVRLI